MPWPELSDRLEFTRENIQKVTNGLGVYVLWDFSDIVVLVGSGIMREDLLVYLNIGGDECVSRHGVAEFAWHRTDSPEALQRDLIRYFDPHCEQIHDEGNQGLVSKPRRSAGQSG